MKFDIWLEIILQSLIEWLRMHSCDQILHLQSGLEFSFFVFPYTNLIPQVEDFHLENLTKFSGHNQMIVL